VKNQSSEDPLNFPIMLNNKIAALEGVVESADAAPTQQSYEIFDMLSGRLGRQLSTLDAAVKKDLPGVNQILEKQNLAPIKPEPLKADKESPR